MLANKQNHIHLLCVDTGYRLGDLSRVMNDMYEWGGERERERKRERESN